MTKGTWQHRILEGGRFLAPFTTAPNTKHRCSLRPKGVIIPGHSDQSCPIMPLQTSCHLDNFWEQSQVQLLLRLEWKSHRFTPYHPRGPFYFRRVANLLAVRRNILEQTWSGYQQAGEVSRRLLHLFPRPRVASSSPSSELSLFE